MPPIFITVAALKGGVGKSVLAHALSSFLPTFGPTLAIDLDPQGTLTASLTDTQDPNSFSVLVRQVKADQAAAPALHSYEGLFVIPSSPALSGIEAMTSSNLERQYIFSDTFQELPNFDYVVIDCPGTTSLLASAPLVASAWAITPVACAPAAYDTLAEMKVWIETIQKRLNPRLQWFIVPTLFDTRQRLDRDVLEALESHYSDYLLRPVIPRRVSISEDMGARRPCRLSELQQMTHALIERTLP